MSELAVRPAERSDIPAMAKIVTDWEAATPWMQSEFDAKQIEGFLSDAFDERIILVTGRPASAYLAFDPERARIGGLYCSATGQGVGKTLINAIKDGRDYLWLNTHEPNLAAQKFYKREGFQEVSNEGAETTTSVPELRMEWHR